MIEIGTTAPDFELPNQDGEPVRLSDLRGGPVVLYFYPQGRDLRKRMRYARLHRSPRDRHRPRFAGQRSGRRVVRIARRTD
jgi:hypothetical protein